MNMVTRLPFVPYAPGPAGAKNGIERIEALWVYAAPPFLAHWVQIRCRVTPCLLVCLAR